MTPKVSVILPTYNGASRGFLSTAIESVLNQSFQDYELLIIDDGSSDHTADECRKYLAKGKVKYIFQENKGLAGARNTGITSSCGEFICFLDDDDVWKPDKLEKQLAFIQNRLSGVDNWGLIFTWLELIDEQGEIISYRGHHQEGRLYRKLLFGNTVDAPSSVLIRRGVFDHVGLFDESLENCEDWDMWLRIAKEYLIFPVKEYLVQHREHKNRMSSDNKEVFHYENVVLKKALLTAPENIDPQKVYASCYVNRSVAHFSLGEYTEFRRMLRRGVRLSPKVLTSEHIFLLIISFWGDDLIRVIKKIKRQLHKMVISQRVRPTH